ncbi:MAG: OmpA family protein [Persicimonas sp.]
MNRFKTMTLAALVATASLVLGACAATTPGELEKARTAYQQVEQSDATQYAPEEAQQAREALMAAEKAKREGGNVERIRTLSYYALRQAQDAQAEGKAAYLVELRNERRSELLAATEEARRTYRTEAQQQRQMRQMTSEQLEEERENLEAMREEMDEQSEELEEEMGLTREEIEQREEELADAVEQLEAEIEAREQAEQELAEALEELDEIAEVDEDNGIINLDNSVLFEFGKSELRPDANDQLSAVADVLRRQEEARITVEGHTDAIGSDEFNEQLSRERAESVRDFLVERGVDPEQVDARGLGEQRPIADNESPEGRAMNRRVEILVDPGEAVGGGPDEEEQREERDEDQEEREDEEDDLEREDDQDQERERDEEDLDFELDEDERMERDQEEPGLEDQPDEDDQMERDEDDYDFEFEDEEEGPMERDQDQPL